MSATVALKDGMKWPQIPSKPARLRKLPPPLPLSLPELARAINAFMVGLRDPASSLDNVPLETPEARTNSDKDSPLSILK